jgi:hypothetical protein
VSANHILQSFLSAENFPEWEWALKVCLPIRETHGIVSSVCKLPVLQNVLITQYRCKIATGNLPKLDAYTCAVPS